MNSEVHVSGHCLAQSLVAAADVCCCRVSWSERPITFHQCLVQRPIQHPITSVSSFLRDLAYAWFLSSCLDFAWYLGSSLVLLRSCLWCWSSDHHVAFVQVTSCILLNYKTINCKFISPIWLCWSSNTKIQSKWAKGPFSLQSPPFGDWWQHDQSKQIITILEFKKYLLARKNYLLAWMQCKGHGYMMLKDTTCKHLWKLIFPCKCPHVALCI